MAPWHGGLGVRVWLFRLYLHWYFWRRFHAVRISRGGLPAVAAGRPVIVYSNHPSWWDPATFILVANKLFPGRPGYGPIDSQSFRQYGLLRRMGAFGVPQDGRRSGAIFLRACLAVLARPDAMLWITAEGGFTDPRARPIVLRPGLAHLARRRARGGHPAACAGIQLLERKPARGVAALRAAGRTRRRDRGAVDRTSGGSPDRDDERAGRRVDDAQSQPVPAAAAGRRRRGRRL